METIEQFYEKDSQKHGKRREFLFAVIV